MSAANSTGSVPARAGRAPSTSRAILEREAFGLFAERGFDETSIEDIAAAAGIARRTFFRYFPAKTDLVWGDFDVELQHLRAYLAAVDPAMSMTDAVHQAVVAFNRVPAGQEIRHRLRLSLILGVPTLLANSTLRFADWRAVIAEFAASRLGLRADDLIPCVIAYQTLGATMAAYEHWLRHDGADLTELLDQALN